MSDNEEEWTMVRRRHGTRSNNTVKQLKKLAIPVVPQPFDVLAEPEERPAAGDGAGKKKKKKKKGKTAAEEDDDEDEDEDAGAPAAQAGAGAKASAAGASGKASAAKGGAAGGGGSAVVQQSLFAWLYAQLVAVLVMLGLMKAAGGKRKKKNKAAAAAAAAPAPAPAAAAAAAPKPVADVKPAAPAPATPAGKSASAAAAAAAAASTAAKKADPAPAATPAAKKAADAAAAAAAAKPAATPEPSKPAAKAVAAAAATPLPGAGKGEAAPAAAAPATPPPAPKPEPPPTPAGPPPPVVKCDKDWAHGKFVMQSLPAAHADVVAAVAVAGDVAVSAGYDGAVKLWSWPLPGSAGGGVVPRLRLLRHLVGHSGRVEALAAAPAGGGGGGVGGGMRLLASSGRDSTLKLWDLGSAADCADARELGSTYVYESVRSLAADWAGAEGGAAGRMLLGSRSGSVMLYQINAGATAGRKVASLRGHGDEVTAVQFRGAHGVVSGARDGCVRLWDLRQAGSGSGKEQVAVLGGLCGRVCSLAALGEHHLAAGDCSSTVKLWDLRKLPPAGARGQPPPAPARVPNAPGFAGDSCPTAGLWWGGRSGVLLSSCIAWWTDNREALEEAPPSAKLPMACLNVSAAGALSPAPAGSSPDDLVSQYKYTLRLGPGIATCMAGSEDESAVLVGGATGALWALRLVRGSAAAVEAAERVAAAAADEGCSAVGDLVVGVEEFSDDDYEEDEDDEDEDD
ncbi:hypothetical protein CHLRE_07g349850v5 [Chlamydomonas reinhardtii]|uniref:Uncharacterized protein n=1 Tax=Chlamydomonas reinhardtii TaxID=3055 RepID=A0A2K3DL96_CHLRE|nr:uncharacterized protein CHLRE_07g349850v5 [Chlamydomonas reinhardtii]PNW81290.1 hypothetical protein CHLRE_07g349850v5 [Chlamydomonas reinhardtii]